MRRIKRSAPAMLGVALVVLFAAACGSSGSSSSSNNSSSSSSSSSAPNGVATSGPGLTQGTTGSGSKVSGGTVYFTEGSDAPPNYIFPMYSFEVCSTTNANQLMNMLYYPLYTYGENYRPTVDYSHSIGQAPVSSNGGKTFTIKLNPYKWSNGEAVTARDLVFWMNVMKASPATEWCGYAPGYFPDNVVSYSAPNPSTFVITFNKAYDPEWVLYSSSRRSSRCRWPGTGRPSRSRRRRALARTSRTRPSPARRPSTSSSTRSPSSSAAGPPRRSGAWSTGR